MFDSYKLNLGKVSFEHLIDLFNLYFARIEIVSKLYSLFKKIVKHIFRIIQISVKDLKKFFRGVNKN